MSATHKQGHYHPLTAGGVLIALGIIFGDIGTSPLYVFKAIIGIGTETNSPVSELLVYGGLSCVFWTLTLVTTIKYVYLALNADNKGEGGIFALYALVRRLPYKWIIFPAIIGSSSLIADGFITPPISISSAIEGLEFIPSIGTSIKPFIVPIVLFIIAALFFAQQFGTNLIGRAFGPIMFIWFTMIAIMGVYNVLQGHWEVIYALHPKYAIHLITMGNGQGFWLLGAVFLCTTGAEALYSDLGHCGKGNIRVSWGFVKVCLILNYMGQAAWLMGHKGELLHEPPFYGMMPDSFRPIGVGIATMATIIASQALITGTFTLANEAMKLKLWPHMKVSYPTQLRGQIYISRMNWLLMFGCMLVVLIFQESGKMEAAYGLAITINLLMTTALLILHLYFKHKDDRSILKNKFTVFGLLLLFLVIETAFFVANIVKFWHGGWFTIIIAVGFIFVMFVLHQARKLRSKYYDFEPLEDRVDLIREVSSDQSIPKEASNLVYLSLSNNPKLIDKNIIYSITRKRPKRADVYWFLHVEIDDDPSTKEYKVDEIVAGKIYFVRLKFGFKIEHRVNLMFRYVVDELIKEEKIEKFSNYPSLSQHGIRSDFKFMLLNSRVSVDDDISPFDQFIIRAYRVIKKYSLATQELFGLDTTNFEEETVPIDVGPIKPIKLERKEEVVRHETGADGHDIIIGSIRKEINEDSQDAIDQ